MTVEVIAYVLSSLAVLWAGGGGHFNEVFSLRVWVASIIVALAAFFLLKSRKELSSLKPNSGSWMMGIGLGFAFTLIGLIFIWFCRSHLAELAEIKNTSVGSIFAWTLILCPASEIIYRKFLAPQWGTKSSAFVEALNFGVGAVSFFLFGLVFIWGYFATRVAMKFGIVAAIIARSLSTLLIIICIKAFF